MMIVMILAMIRGLLRFNKELMRLHWFFDFFSLGFNIFAFLIYVPVLSIAGAHQWNAIDVIIILCITMQIPLQLWAISVVKSCLDFFILLHVFVEIAEI